jgi:hypothetical protein
MKYRSRTDIVSQILEAANGGATKTKIMYVQGVPFVRAAKGIPVGAGGEWAAGVREDNPDVQDHLKRPPVSKDLQPDRRADSAGHRRKVEAVLFFSNERSRFADVV